MLDVQDKAGKWTKAADLNSACAEVELPEGAIKAIRVQVDKPQRYWLIVREMEVE